MGGVDRELCSMEQWETVCDSFKTTLINAVWENCVHVRHEHVRLDDHPPHGTLWLMHCPKRSLGATTHISALHGRPKNVEKEHQTRCKRQTHHGTSQDLSMVLSWSGNRTSHCTRVWANGVPNTLMPRWSAGRVVLPLNATAIRSTHLAATVNKWQQNGSMPLFLRRQMDYDAEISPQLTFGST